MSIFERLRGSKKPEKPATDASSMSEESDLTGIRLDSAKIHRQVDEIMETPLLRDISFDRGFRELLTASLAQRLAGRLENIDNRHSISAVWQLETNSRAAKHFPDSQLRTAALSNAQSIADTLDELFRTTMTPNSALVRGCVMARLNKQFLGLPPTQVLG